MFSFFKNKKPSPPSSPELDPIPGPNSSNDFVVVNPNPNSDPSGGNSFYPNFNQHFGRPIPTGGGSGNGSGSPTKDQSIHHPNYLHGVPFKLSSELSLGDSDEINKIQIDDILASITSKMEVAKHDYDFSLERSIVAQE